jgi:hypothetical protein
MKKALLIFCCVSVLFSLNSCSLDTTEENFQFTTLEVVSVDFPEAFDHNQIHEIEVIVLRPDTCTFFEGFEVTAPDLTIRNVSAVGTVLTNEDCDQTVEEVTATFSFRVDYTDTYVFRFYGGNDDDGNAVFLEYEVPVNQ